MAGLVGTKIGMTRVMSENGDITPVTLVSLAEENVVLRVFGAEDNKRIDVGAKPYKRQYKNKKYKYIAGFPLYKDEEIKPGDKLDLSLVQVGDRVSVIGFSKGKGFQGAMKRHNFRGCPRTHGHPHNRRVGSIGARSTPGKVWRGKRMPGRMGEDHITLKNVEVVRIDDTNKLLALKGALPGSNGGQVKMIISASSSRDNAKTSSNNE